jgi:hypothetical protein
METLLQECLSRLSNDSEFLKFLVVCIGAGWTLYEWRQRRISERKKLAAELFEKFKTNSDVALATRMLDWIAQCDIGSAVGGGALCVVSDDRTLTAALATLDEKESFTPSEQRVRTIFDGFLTELGMLNGYLSSGLLHKADVEPFIGYWIQTLNGSGALYRPAVVGQLRKFIANFGFDGVQELLWRYSSSPFDRLKVGTRDFQRRWLGISPRQLHSVAGGQ